MRPLRLAVPLLALALLGPERAWRGAGRARLPAEADTAVEPDGVAVFFLLGPLPRATFWLPYASGQPVYESQTVARSGRYTAPLDVVDVAALLAPPPPPP